MIVGVSNTERRIRLHVHVITRDGFSVSERVFQSQQGDRQRALRVLRSRRGAPQDIEMGDEAQVGGTADADLDRRHDERECRVMVGRLLPGIIGEPYDARGVGRAQRSDEEIEKVLGMDKTAGAGGAARDGW
jgi:hypothetical protein